MRLSIFRAIPVSAPAVISLSSRETAIPAEDLPHIFERFYKSDRSRGLDKTGTGLGLYIVKTILEKHGESIHVESAVGVYTEFWFTLSLAGGKKAKETEPAQPRESFPENATPEDGGQNENDRKEGYWT